MEGIFEFAFVPVIGSNDKATLPGNPRDLVRKGAFKECDIIFGKIRVKPCQHKGLSLYKMWVFRMEPERRQLVRRLHVGGLRQGAQFVDQRGFVREKPG